jgi:DNA-binding protein HU-beta
MTDSEAAVTAFLDAITEELSKGNHITIMGFGTFDVKRHAMRHSINPATRKPMTIPTRRFPRFKASRMFKDELLN